MNLKKYFADGLRRLIEMSRLFLAQFAANGSVIMELLFFLRFKKNDYKFSENYIKKYIYFFSGTLVVVSGLKFFQNNKKVSFGWFLFIRWIR